MIKFNRREHVRTNAYGTTFMVREHSVRLEHSNNLWFKEIYGSPEYKAADLLRRNNVGIGAQGCFVNPNAKCPVCSKPVFFYVNSFGSRVYFDDIGHPWPKHPCTNMPVMRKRAAHDNWKPITKRKNGEIQELIEAANATGLFLKKKFGILNNPGWNLLHVENVIRTGERNDVSTTIIDASERRPIKFYCFSNEPIFGPGDFLSFNDRIFSALEKNLFKEIQFYNGSKIHIMGNDITVEGSSDIELHAPISQNQIRNRQADIQRKDKEEHKKLIKKATLLERSLVRSRSSSKFYGTKSTKIRNKKKLVTKSNKLSLQPESKSSKTGTAKRNGPEIIEQTEHVVGGKKLIEVKFTRPSNKKI